MTIADLEDIGDSSEEQTVREVREARSVRSMREQHLERERGVTSNAAGVWRRRNKNCQGCAAHHFSGVCYDGQEVAKSGSRSTSRKPTGNAGETHQRAGGSAELLTTDQGIPVADNQNSLKVGERGPVLLEDFMLREKITNFDHERIPERVVHARGFGAHGYFQPYKSHAKLTKAAFLQDPA